MLAAGSRLMASDAEKWSLPSPLLASIRLVTWASSARNTAGLGNVPLTVCAEHIALPFLLTFIVFLVCFSSHGGCFRFSVLRAKEMEKGGYSHMQLEAWMEAGSKGRVEGCVSKWRRRKPMAPSPRRQGSVEVPGQSQAAPGPLQHVPSQDVGDRILDIRGCSSDS